MKLPTIIATMSAALIALLITVLVAFPVRANTGPTCALLASIARSTVELRDAGLAEKIVTDATAKSLVDANTKAAVLHVIRSGYALTHLDAESYSQVVHDLCLKAQK